MKVSGEIFAKVPVLDWTMLLIDALLWAQDSSSLARSESIVSGTLRFLEQLFSKLSKRIIARNLVVSSGGPSIGIAFRVSNRLSQD